MRERGREWEERGSSGASERGEAIWHIWQEREERKEEREGGLFLSVCACVCVCPCVCVRMCLRNEREGRGREECTELREICQIQTHCSLCMCDRETRGGELGNR